MKKNGALAQLVEQWTENPCVPGSIPGGTTKNPNKLFGFFIYKTMHYLYIIYSKSLNKYYVGESHDVKKRLEQHKNHHYKSNFSRRASDWELLLQKQLENREQALYLEKFIKRMKSKKFTEKVINDPKILDNILNKK